jgi:hypothetical protein
MQLRKYIILTTLPVILISSGCSSLGKSMGLGAGVGAGTGAILGGIADPGKNGKYRTRNVVIGATLGGLAGMATGSAIHGMKEDERKKGYIAGKHSKSTVAQGLAPNLKDPKVETRWVEGRAVGNKYIEGHFEYIIAEPTRWDID